MKCKYDIELITPYDNVRAVTRVTLDGFFNNVIAQNSRTHFRKYNAMVFCGQIMNVTYLLH